MDGWLDGWDYAILRGDFARKGLTARKEPGSQSCFACKDRSYDHERTHPAGTNPTTNVELEFNLTTRDPTLLCSAMLS